MATSKKYHFNRSPSYSPSSKIENVAIPQLLDFGFPRNCIEHVDSEGNVLVLCLCFGLKRGMVPACIYVAISRTQCAHEIWHLRFSLMQ